MFKQLFHRVQIVSSVIYMYYSRFSGSFAARLSSVLNAFDFEFFFSFLYLFITSLAKLKDQTVTKSTSTWCKISTDTSFETSSSEEHTHSAYKTMTS